MIVGIIQSRVGSTRLAGKILLEVCGKTFLEHMIERVSRSNKLNKILIATTTNEKDNAIVNLCNKIGVNCYRGSEEDVLLRYKIACEKINAATVVRLNGDCPLIDPLIIDSVIQVYLDNNYDYVSNSYPPPSSYPIGTSVEVFSSDVLKKIESEAKKPSEREHVTSFIWNHPEIFQIYRIDYEKDLSKYRLTLDYKEDYQLLKLIFEELYPKNSLFTINDVIEFLDSNPSLLKINSHILPHEGWLKSLKKDKKLGFTN